MVGPALTSPDRMALRFVLLIGVLSLFADSTYEGSRSILGQYLASFKVSATVVGIVTGFGELAGYGLRLASGRLADVTRRFWPIIIFGYVLQMVSVPALALTTSWPAAAALIITERVGKAIRNPPRDVLLSFAAERIGGYGWAFGLHEAFDQSGAVLGPLLVAAMLAYHGSYRYAFAVLAVPAIINIALVLIARAIYPRPQDLAMQQPASSSGAFPRIYWIYLVAAALVAMGFADYPLIAFHLKNSRQVSGESIAVFYVVAMGVSGSGSLLFGRLFDRFGFELLTVLTAVSSLFAPLVFLGGFWSALL
jgi:predicted MFS family arabinose efflux permease